MSTSTPKTRRGSRVAAKIDPLAIAREARVHVQSLNAAVDRLLRKIRYYEDEIEVVTAKLHHAEAERLAEQRQKQALERAMRRLERRAQGNEQRAAAEIARLRAQLASQPVVAPKREWKATPQPGLTDLEREAQARRADRLEEAQRLVESTRELVHELKGA